ncbi:FecR family protein [Ruegeria sp.]|uniref:FecR family protein n=1 Tax=Ruegeria sp. TaxID=1879320 RepID=UPI003B5C99CF
MAWFKLLLVTWCILILPSQVLSDIGQVIGVEQGAKVTREGKSQTLRAGMAVVSGDSISTDGSGVVQLLFVDETKIAIGPNARMTLDVTMLRGNKKAKNFAVQALGGSFRFISGKSKKRAYSIQTPTATMAVRGTTFDMWVASGTQSAMLVLEGRVEMCSLNGGCRATGRQCSLFATTQNGSVGRAVDQEEFEKALKSGFPFVQSQEQLLAPLQVDIGGCATEALRVPPPRSDAPTPTRERREAGTVKSAEAAAPRSDPPASPAPADPGPGPAANPGSGNGGNIGGNTGTGNGNGGNIGGTTGGDGNGGGGNIGGGSGSGDGSGGSIGGGTGSGGPGSGGTIGGGSTGGFGGSAGSGGTNGNGGNSGGS